MILQKLINASVKKSAEYNDSYWVTLINPSLKSNGQYALVSQCDSDRNIYLAGLSSSYDDGTYNSQYIKLNENGKIDTVINEKKDTAYPHYGKKYIKDSLGNTYTCGMTYDTYGGAIAGQMSVKVSKYDVNNVLLWSNMWWYNYSQIRTIHTTGISLNAAEDKLYVGVYGVYGSASYTSYTGYFSINTSDASIDKKYYFSFSTSAGVYANSAVAPYIDKTTGYVYSSCYTSDATNYDSQLPGIIFVKNADGTTIFEARLSRGVSGYQTYIYDLITDNNYLYVVSYINGTGNAISRLNKSTGSLSNWSKRISYNNDATMFIQKISIDSLGNIYLMASRSSAIVSGYAYIILKYDSAMNLLWAREFSGGITSVTSYSMSIDNHDNVIVSGGIVTDAPAPSTKYSFVAKIPSDGSGIGDCSTEYAPQLMYRDITSYITIAADTATTFTTGSYGVTTTNYVASAAITNPISYKFLRSIYAIS